MQLAERMKLVSDSITLAVSAKANALKKAGVDVVGFGAGEPDFDTPAFIKDAAKAALDKGQTKYTPTPCFPELKPRSRRSSIAKTNCPTSPRTSPPAPAGSTACTWRSWRCSIPAMRCSSRRRIGSAIPSR